MKLLFCFPYLTARIFQTFLSKYTENFPVKPLYDRQADNPYIEKTKYAVKLLSEILYITDTLCYMTERGTIPSVEKAKKMQSNEQLNAL